MMNFTFGLLLFFFAVGSSANLQDIMDLLEVCHFLKVNLKDAFVKVASLSEIFCCFLDKSSFTRTFIAIDVYFRGAGDNGCFRRSELVDKACKLIFVSLNKWVQVFS